jgi:uncharacterized protein (TIGR02646 family)
MIRVLRPVAPPQVLVTDGAAKAQQHCAEYAANVREFTFDAKIYGHADVKQMLVNMHHGKCCYCESKVRHTGPGTIDHYRPKAASQQQEGTPFIRPGYYWLAYDWENLLFSCTTCNQSHKRNLFPLRDNAQRAQSHLHPLDQEEPLLIDPSRENPADFISFREEIAFALNGNLRGQTTIEILALNDRNDLVEERRDKITALRIIRDIVNLMPESPEGAEAQQYLDEAVLDTAKYTAMCRAFLQ